MFDGQTYRRFGVSALCIGFTGRQRDDEHTCRDGGVVTLAYASEFSAADKAVMATRVLAVLNLTSQLTLNDLERAAPLAGLDPDYSGFCGRTFRQLEGSRNLVIAFADRCPVHGLFGKNGGFAMCNFADEIEQSHKPLMARRVVAALNYARNLSLDNLIR